MQIGLETLTVGNPQQAMSLCSTMEQLLGEVNANLQLHYQLWKLSIWHLQRPPRSCCGCEDSSRSWAMEPTIPPICSRTAKVLSRFPRTQSHMQDRNTSTCVTILSAMQFRIMSSGYSTFLQRI